MVSVLAKGMEWTTPAWSCACATRALGRDGEVTGMVSVLAERAVADSPRSTRAVETTPVTSPGEHLGAWVAR